MAKKVPHEILMQTRGSTASQVVHNERNQIVADDYGPDEVFDRTNPKSVYNMVPESLRGKMENIPHDLWNFTIKELEVAHTDISPIDRRLRQSFWFEYDQAHKQNRSMRISTIIRGICSRTLFQENIAGRPHRLRYLLEPPEDYKITMHELLATGMEELREILSLPNKTIDLNGNEIADSKLAAVKLKAVEMIYNRLQGMPIHRSMQITQNTNFNHQVGGQIGAPDFSQIQDVNELEKIVQRLEGSSSVLDAALSGGTKEGIGEGLKDE